MLFFCFSSFNLITFCFIIYFSLARSAGHIVPELGDLTSLRTLSLRDNHFTGTIPPELGQLTALRHLFLNNNKLRGASVVPRSGRE